MKERSKYSYIYGVLILLVCCTNSYAQWKPVGNRIVSDWATQIDINNVLSEYPRPLMERTDKFERALEICHSSIGQGDATSV